MVAKITTPKKIIAALNYNENKVIQGKAECIHAVNFLKEANEMNFYQKLQRFERLNELNERAQTKTLHVSLNFDPSEKIGNNMLIQIASDYMNKIGFGEQPFLIYKHQDAGHPHIHVITTTIRDDGSRINTHNIGRNQSEKARKEIENIYGLVCAERQKQFLKQNTLPVNPEKIIYGKTETKKSITSVVNSVLNTYRYSSLPEFNAILKQYNVIADKGSEEGRIYKNRGLIYRILDADGNKIGVPIKASLINSQPTLARLEKLFVLNNTKKEPYTQHLKKEIDLAFTKQPENLRELIKLLEQNKIYSLLRQNAEGRIYGITFVDNQNKVVFNGSDLGKQYSAGYLQNRILSNSQKQQQDQVTVDNIKNHHQKNEKLQQKNFQHNSNLIEHQNLSLRSPELIEELVSAEQQHEIIPFQLRKKKKKKKKRSLGL